MKTADQIIDALLDREGGEYSNRAEDSGGPTKWGWTLTSLSEVYERTVSIFEVQSLEREEARALYLRIHWYRTGFDKLNVISSVIAAELLDTHVNLPPARAGEFLQRALNAFNMGGKKYDDVTVDGQCGPATRVALAAYLAWRGKEGESVLLQLLNCQLGSYYLERAQSRAQNEFNIYGWILNRVLLEA